MKKIFLAILAVATAFAVSAQYKAPQIVANGGYHKAPSSGAKNTISALKAAQKLKVYASECDVNLTKDGEVLVVQSGWHPNRKASPKADVQRSTLEKMLTVPYANGEYISTLEDFLKRVKKKPAPAHNVVTPPFRALETARSVGSKPSSARRWGVMGSRDSL